VFTGQRLKKKRKIVAKGKLSFGLDEEEEPSPSSTSLPPTVIEDANQPPSSKRSRLGPNTALPTPPPTAMTKSALSALAAQKEILRQEFLARQNLVRAAPIAIPFVFHDGTDTPGGKIHLKKGDQVWLFLDKARKVGAELSVGGDRGLREWARVSVDDLMIVRNGVIIPHVCLLLFWFPHAGSCQANLPWHLSI
jgi:protein FAM50